jgi:hypothetical protein
MTGVSFAAACALRAGDDKLEHTDPNSATLRKKDIWAAQGIDFDAALQPRASSGFGNDDELTGEGHLTLGATRNEDR